AWSGGDQHRGTEAGAREAGGDRPSANHDQGGTHPIDSRRLIEKAQHEPSPPDKQPCRRDQGRGDESPRQAPSPGFYPTESSTPRGPLCVWCFPAERGRVTTAHLGSIALNCSSSRIFSFNFCAFSSFEPAPGPATT